MAWIKRVSHAYFYKKQRIGNKVKSIYFGKDEGAGVIAEVDANLRYAARLRAEENKLRPQPKSQ